MTQLEYLDATRPEDRYTAKYFRYIRNSIPPPTPTTIIQSNGLQNVAVTIVHGVTGKAPEFGSYSYSF